MFFVNIKINIMMQIFYNYIFLYFQRDFCTSHVVRLYGVVSQNEPVFILTEFMQQGDLKSFLRLHHLDNDSFCFAPPTLKVFISFKNCFFNCF